MQPIFRLQYASSVNRRKINVNTELNFMVVIEVYQTDFNTILNNTETGG